MQVKNPDVLSLNDRDGPNYGWAVIDAGPDARGLDAGSDDGTVAKLVR